jgi:hypothetical protein
MNSWKGWKSDFELTGIFLQAPAESLLEKMPGSAGQRRRCWPPHPVAGRFREEKLPTSEAEREMVLDFKASERPPASDADHPGNIIPLPAPSVLTRLAPAIVGVGAISDFNGTLYLIHFVYVHVEHLHCFFSPRGNNGVATVELRRRGR